jgi:hypothetical protein
VPSDPSESGFEKVFTVTDYYDGPRQGIANYTGSPHYYDCVFSDEKQDYTSVYSLTPISDEVFRLALEDWAIWRRWEQAFHTGQTSLETHPALPEDAVRHGEIESLVAESLKMNRSTSIVREGNFIVLKQTEVRGRLADLLVRWAEPSSAARNRG